MELYQIRYFMALCETLNFARAAERCRISAPSLTRAVQKLEQEMGGLLVRRERRRTHLTELGRLVRPMLKEVLAHAESTKTAAHRFLKTEEQPLQLGVMPSVGPLCLAPFLAQFGKLRPEIALALVEGEEARLEELLLGGNLDVAVVARLGSAAPGLRHQRLYRESVVVAFPLGHRFAGQGSVRLGELRGESFLLRTHCEKRELLLKSCRKQGFEPKIVYRSEREDWIQMMVAAGHGIALMPESLHLGHGTLARPLIEPALDREVSLVTVAGRPHTPAVQHLVRAIRTYEWDHEISAAKDGAYRLPLMAERTDVGGASGKSGNRRASQVPIDCA
jgi:LysR family transcriptional regulator, hydrogen peroxide-inducible genes activator